MATQEPTTTDTKKEATPSVPEATPTPGAPPPPGPTFAEVWFDDPVEGEVAQRAAAELKSRIELRARPIRCYLEDTVVPLLLQGLQHLVLERPENPVKYLAAFLLKNDPFPPPEQIEVTFPSEPKEPEATKPHEEKVENKPIETPSAPGGDKNATPSKPVKPWIK